MDGIFLKFIKTACREIANYPKYILKLPKGDTGRTISNESVRTASEVLLINSWIMTMMGFIRPFCMCSTKKEEYYPMQKPVCKGK